MQSDIGDGGDAEGGIEKPPSAPGGPGHTLPARSAVRGSPPGKCDVAVEAPVAVTARRGSVRTSRAAPEPPHRAAVADCPAAGRRIRSLFEPVMVQRQFNSVKGSGLPYMSGTLAGFALM